MAELTRLQKGELESQGYTMTELRGLESNKKQYWNPKTGSWTEPLPGDRARMSYYLRKGLLLDKPQEKTPEPPKVQEVTDEITSGSYVCPECGYQSKDGVGLAIHRRKAHHPKKYHKKN